MSGQDDLETLLYKFLCRKYVQQQDERQKSMGLQYMRAETTDLARELTKFFDAYSRAERDKAYQQGFNAGIGCGDIKDAAREAALNEARSAVIGALRDRYGRSARGDVVVGIVDDAIRALKNKAPS